MRRALSAFAIAGAVVLGPSIGVVDAATVVQAGWWDRDADSLLPALDPPPEGALRVANDPTGASAIAAVRAQLAEGEQDPTLVLRVAGDPVPEGAALVACPATSQWEPAEGAPLAEAPTSDCEVGAALGAVSADGTAVAFDLSTLPDGEVVDVVILPAPAGENPVTDTFAVDFEAPTDADVVARSGAGDGSPVPPGAPTGSGGGSPTVATGGSTPSVGGASPSFTPSPSGGLGVPASPDVTVPAGAVTTGGGGTSTAAPVTEVEESAAPPLEAASSSDKRWIGLVTILAILALGGSLWRADRARAAMTAGPVLGGLGPFVRERSGPAPEVA